MKLHTTLISGALVTAVAVDERRPGNSRLRYLKADSKSSKRATKTGKSSYSYSRSYSFDSSSYSSSYSMSYGPPSPPSPPSPPGPVPPTVPPTTLKPTPNPTTLKPTPNPTRLAPPTVPPTTPTPTTLSPTTLSPTTRPPTSNPTTPPPTNQPTGPCCGTVRETILANVYNGGNDSIFQNQPAKDAIEWLEKDACTCGIFCPSLEQRYIQATLYFATKGDEWDNCSAPDDIQDDSKCNVQSSYGFSDGYHWLTCTTECEWGGNRCNKNGYINVTDIENNGLNGKLPPEIGALPKLSALALEQNSLKGPIPPSYSGLTELAVLDFDFNQLTGSLMDMSAMPKLQQLDLNNNNLSGRIDGLGWEKTNLKFLDLAYNEFEGTIATEIGLLPALRSLQFQCNDFVAPLVWDSCPSKDLIADVEVCDDSNCDCTGIEPSECATKQAKRSEDEG